MCGLNSRPEASSILNPSDFQHSAVYCHCMTRIPLPRSAAILFVLTIVSSARIAAQTAVSPQSDATKPKPEDTEVWSPEPAIVTPGATCGAPPSDATILFDGKNLDEWVSAKDHTPAQWIVADGVMTVNKSAGNIETKRKFKNYQLHIEWRIPENITGSGQARGNS